MRYDLQTPAFSLSYLSIGKKQTELPNPKYLAPITKMCLGYEKSACDRRLPQWKQLVGAALWTVNYQKRHISNLQSLNDSLVYVLHTHRHIHSTQRSRQTHMCSRIWTHTRIHTHQKHKHTHTPMRTHRNTLKLTLKTKNQTNTQTHIHAHTPKAHRQTSASKTHKRTCVCTHTSPYKHATANARAHMRARTHTHTHTHTLPEGTDKHTQAHAYMHTHVMYLTGRDLWTDKRMGV